MPEEQDNNKNSSNNGRYVDARTWVAFGDMRYLPTNVFKKNSLPPNIRKTIVQFEPKNKDTVYLLNHLLWIEKFGLTHHVTQNFTNHEYIFLFFFPHIQHE